ncbi:hypothetical protein DFJ74DRAFT_160084 [Hyaloraphidium curvatum]|nr:hypothetical protein DFJ74DRAFT_160084 [Hyaloraphidium curvatum]
MYRASLLVPLAVGVVATLLLSMVLPRPEKVASSPSPTPKVSSAGYEGKQLLQPFVYPLEKYLPHLAKLPIEASVSGWGVSTSVWSNETVIGSFGRRLHFVKCSGIYYEFSYTPLLVVVYCLVIDVVVEEGFVPVVRNVQAKVVGPPNTRAPKRRCSNELEGEGKWLRCFDANLANPAECLRWGWMFEPHSCYLENWGHHGNRFYFG